MRPYQASLTCTVAGSELLIFTRTDFYRVFKAQSDSWKYALKYAKQKELEYINRCRCYLDINKQIIEKQKQDIKRTFFGFNNESKEEQADRRVKALRHRDDIQFHMDKFNRLSQERHDSNASDDDTYGGLVDE